MGYWAEGLTTAASADTSGNTGDGWAAGSPRWAVGLEHAHPWTKDAAGRDAEACAAAGGHSALADAIGCAVRAGLSAAAASGGPLAGQLGLVVEAAVDTLPPAAAVRAAFATLLAKGHEDAEASYTSNGGAVVTAQPVRAAEGRRPAAGDDDDREEWSDDPDYAYEWPSDDGA